MTFGVPPRRRASPAGRARSRAAPILDEVARAIAAIGRRRAPTSSACTIAGPTRRGGPGCSPTTGRRACSYQAYADEVRRVLESAAPSAYQVFVATDEIEFLEFMRHEFGDRVIWSDDSPRVHAGELPIHLDRTLPVSNYQKGKSAIVDCLLLAADRLPGEGPLEPVGRVARLQSAAAVLVLPTLTQRTRSPPSQLRDLCGLRSRSTGRDRARTRRPPSSASASAPAPC